MIGIRGDRPRLGELSHPAVPQDPGARLRSNRSAERTPLGRGRARRRRRTFGDSNAVFGAIGVRLRSVPFTPDKVMAAMKDAA